MKSRKHSGNQVSKGIPSKPPDGREEAGATTAPVFPMLDQRGWIRGQEAAAASANTTAAASAASHPPSWGPDPGTWTPAATGISQDLAATRAARGRRLLHLSFKTI